MLLENVILWAVSARTFVPQSIPKKVQFGFRLSRTKKRYNLRLAMAMRQLYQMVNKVMKGTTNRIYRFWEK